MQPITDCWRMLEEQLRADAPQVLDDLNPPAGAAGIEHLQSMIGKELPLQFVAFLMVHDGQAGQARGMFNGHECLSVRNILLEWVAWNDLAQDGEFDDRCAQVDPRIRRAWWLPHWIPFTSDGAGNHHCLDLDPAATGSFGQIIRIYHDMPDRVYCAPDFLSWVREYLPRQQR